MSFYNILSELCNNNGTTVTAFAKKLGLSTSMPTNWKKGMNPNIETLVKIADYFNVTPDYLLGYTDNVKVKHLSVSNFNDISFNSEEISKSTEILSLCEDLSDKDIEFVIKLIKLVREYSQE